MCTKYFARKLTSLGYPESDTFDVSDDKQYRFIVAWLENRFIRHYDLEQRANLNNATSNDWLSFYDKYLVDLNVPFKSDDLNSSLDWILGLAVKSHYDDNNAKMHYSNLTGEQFRKSSALITSLDSIDMNSSEFKKGVYQLATLLGVAHHPDHVRVLKACSLVIVEKFSPAAVAAAKAEEGKIKLHPVSIDDSAHGIKSDSDIELKRITTILRLLHMHNLRQLQMDINASIIGVQELVADPKTNEKLGKVGY